MPAPVIKPVKLTPAQQIISSLNEIERFINEQPALAVEDRELIERVLGESDRIHKANAALVLGVLADEYCPLEMFKLWACKRSIREWRDSYGLDVVIFNNRCCVKPSAFFRHLKANRLSV